MKTQRKLLALFSSVSLTCCSLSASTYYMQSLGGTNGSPPWPMDPYNGAYPLEQIAPDTYLVENGNGSMSQYGMMAADDSIDPNDTNNVGTNTYSNNSAPNIRNYAKYSQQVYALLNTNDVSGYDTNLYNTCAAIPATTNTTPWLTIVPYGPNAVVIRADNFDYTPTNADFALLVCDKVETPIWKAVDFAHASDAQDGWLLQGSIPSWQVTSPMFMLVSNINTTYNAFFKVIPYLGPQVAIIGTNQPDDTVSNTITVTAQVLDLSGTTNEQFSVDINGSPCFATLGTNNSFTIDTTYSANGICNVDLQVLGQPDVNDPLNPSRDQQVYFSGLATMPLDFENDTYLLWQSDNASPDIGTNYIEFVISKPQYCAAIISHPSTGAPVFAATNYFGTPGTIAIPWNFTEADGVTPYSETNYAVQIIAFDPASFDFTNAIDWTGVRHGSGTYMCYEDEDYSLSDAYYLNLNAANWASTERYLFNDIYDQNGQTQYTENQIGPNRDLSEYDYQSPGTPDFKTFLMPAITNHIDDNGTTTTNAGGGPVRTSASTYCDFTIMEAHGSGSTIGGAWPSGALTNDFNTLDLRLWMTWTYNPNWRMRKAAFWPCYSSSYNGFVNLTGNYPGNTFPDACGIRPQGLQEVSFMRKNCGLFFNGLVPQGGFGGNSANTTAQVAEALDQLWVTGPNGYPGGDDPTYSWSFCINSTRGQFNPQMDSGGPLLFGIRQMIYTSIYDDQLMLLNYSNVKGQ